MLGVASEPHTAAGPYGHGHGAQRHRDTESFQVELSLFDSWAPLCLGVSVASFRSVPELDRTVNFLGTQ